MHYSYISSFLLLLLLLNKLKLNVFLYNFYTDKIFKVLTFYSRVMVMVSTFMRSCDEEDLRAAMAALQI